MYLPTRVIEPYAPQARRSEQLLPVCEGHAGCRDLCLRLHWALTDLVGIL